MCHSTVVNAVPESSMWHGAISVEDAQLVRVRHAEKVEEWLDEAEFCTELFKLHEKYGIDLGEEGYADYRDYLRASYYQKLQTYGPTPNPLDEGCDCIFCKMHAEETPAEPEARRVRCADQPAENNQHESGPHSGPYITPDKNENVRSKNVVSSTASGECELPEAMSNEQGTDVPRSPAVNQNQTETRRTLCVDHAVQEGHPEIGPSPAEKNSIAADDALIANDESISRYDSVGGVEPDWGKKELPPEQMFVRVYPPQPRKPVAELVRSQKDEREIGLHSGPYATAANDSKNEDKLGLVPAEPPDNSDIRDDHRRRKRKLKPAPAYVQTAGEKAWLKKMSGTVF